VVVVLYVGCEDVVCRWLEVWLYVVGGFVG